MLKLQYFGHLMRRVNSLEKYLMLERLKAGGEGDNEGQDGWTSRLDQLNEREFQQAPGDGKGQGCLLCCSPWGHKESNTTE